LVHLVVQSHVEVIQVKVGPSEVRWTKVVWIKAERAKESRLGCLSKGRLTRDRLGSHRLTFDQSYTVRLSYRSELMRGATCEVNYNGKGVSSTSSNISIDVFCKRMCDLCLEAKQREAKLTRR